MTRTEQRKVQAALWWSTRLYILAAAGVVLLVSAVVWNSIRITGYQSQHHTDVSEKSSATAVATAAASLAARGKALAMDVNRRCTTSRVFRQQNAALCPRASELATAAPSPSLVPGPIGRSGPQGRGIASVRNVAGHLVITLTDGTAVDAGPYVGAAGKPGRSGRGIKQETIVNGHLVVSYTDGSIADVGQVVGSVGPSGTQGVSVTDVHIDDADAHLIITFSDGRTQDAGQLPAGPQGEPGPAVTGPTGPTGPKGDPGPACMSGYSPVQQPQLDGGSVEVCTSPPPS